MFKKICFALFLFCTILLMTGILMIEFSSKTYYFISLAILICGLVLYPLQFPFQSNYDFLVLPILAVLAFSVINLLFFQNYNDGLALVNFFTGAFGFAQYCLQKKLISSAWK